MPRPLLLRPRTAYIINITRCILENSPLIHLIWLKNYLTSELRPSGTLRGKQSWGYHAPVILHPLLPKLKGHRVKITSIFLVPRDRAGEPLKPAYVNGYLVGKFRHMYTGADNKDTQTTSVHMSTSPFTSGISYRTGQLPFQFSTIPRPVQQLELWPCSN